jgi:hypothetical protein
VDDESAHAAKSGLITAGELGVVEPRFCHTEGRISISEGRISISERSISSGSRSGAMLAVSCFAYC